MKQNGKKLSSQNGKSKSLVTNGKSNNGNGNGKLKKILPERKPLILHMLAMGESYKSIAEAFTKEFESIDPSAIFKYATHYPEEVQSFKDEFYANVKAIPIANAKVRIEKLRAVADRLENRLMEFLDYTPMFWKDVNLASLIKAWKELHEQIQDEAGDKVQKFRGEGLPPISNYFGDVIVNTYADQVVEARSKETVASGNRLKTAGFSDFGNPLSGN